MRIAKRSVVKTFALVLLFLSATCNNISRQEKESSTTAHEVSSQVPAVPITYNGYIIFESLIDGIRANFLLDLGTNDLHIDSLFLSQSGLIYTDLVEIVSTGIGNSEVRHQLIYDTVRFNISNKEYMTVQTGIFNIKPVGGDFIDVLLGKRFFMESILKINYSEKYFKTVNSIDSIDISGYKALPTTSIDGFICIPLTFYLVDTLTIDGMFIIDTGMPFSSFVASVAEKNNLNEKIERKVRYYTSQGGIGGESSGYDFIASSLEISDFKLMNVNISYSLDKYGLMADGNYSGIIGNDILDRFDLIFDFVNEILYLRPNDNFNKPFIFERLGFFFVNRSKTMGVWQVTGLSDNSPAQNNGVQIHDEILSVNGIPVTDIPFESQRRFFDTIDVARLELRNDDGIKLIEFELKPLLR